MRHNTQLAILLFAQLAAGCAGRSSVDPFFVPREEFRQTAQTIALAPVVAPHGIEIAESLLVQIDDHIEATLLAGGYRCVSGDEYQETWDRILAQMGGLYDSLTGEFDELRFEVAREQLRLDLVDLYHPDYMLYPEIWVVEAPFSGGVAKWDGVSQPLVGWGTRILNAIDAVLNNYNGFLEPGVIDALSLGIVVESMDGVEVFRNAAGIEVLKEAGASEDALMPDQVLADLERNYNAVRTVLLSLLEARASGTPVG